MGGWDGAGGDEGRVMGVGDQGLEAEWATLPHVLSIVGIGELHGCAEG